MSNEQVRVPRAPARGIHLARDGGDVGAMKKRANGLLGVVPVIGDGLAMLRLLFDRDASFWAKVLVLGVVAYIVSPLDAIPDAIPVIGWLDDLGVMMAVRVALSRHLDPYRYPLFAKRAPPPLDPPAAHVEAVPQDPQAVVVAGRGAPGRMIEGR